MCPEERTYLAHRQGNPWDPILGALAKIQTPQEQLELLQNHRRQQGRWTRRLQSHPSKHALQGFPAFVHIAAGGKPVSHLALQLEDVGLLSLSGRFLVGARRVEIRSSLPRSEGVTSTFAPANGSRAPSSGPENREPDNLLLQARRHSSGWPAGSKLQARNSRATDIISALGWLAVPPYTPVGNTTRITLPVRQDSRCACMHRAIA
jgi:hypothetical protein